MKLDQIYVISLFSSKPRQKRIKEWLPNSDNITWWLVKRKSDPKYGVFSSHRDILLDAKRKGYKYIVVFEDDAVPAFNWKRAENEIELFLNGSAPKQWKILALGYWPVMVSKTNRKNLVNIHCSFGAHAYLVNVKNVSVPEWDGTQVDDLMFCDGVAEKLQFAKLKRNRGIYGVKPILFNQFSKVSSIKQFHMIPQYFMEKFGNETILNSSQYVNLVLLSVFIVFLCLSLFILIPVAVACSYSKCRMEILWILLSIFGILFFVFIVFFLIDCYKMRIETDETI